jgi:hypothetical protein
MVIRKVQGDHPKGELRPALGAPMMTAGLMAGAR